MKKILFRGKTHDGEWVEGLPFFGDDGNTIDGIEGNNRKLFKVIPETVGQFTGLTDKNGKKIFEGDIINERPPMNIYTFRGFVVWDDGRALWRLLFTEHPEYLAVLGTYSTFYTVVGNIYDNPELLKVTK